MSVFTPDSIKALKAFLTAQGATISIARFCEPTSSRQFRGYHLGKSQIMQGGDGCTPSGTADYSIQTARDKAGLTDARAAIDIQFSKVKLQNYSKWLVAQARADAPGTSDLREIIYSPDGVTVLRWDRERGVNSAPKSGEADNSHLWHTHVSFYRDSEARAKVATFSGFFVPSVPVPTPPAETDAEKIARLEAELDTAQDHAADLQVQLDAANGTIGSKDAAFDAVLLDATTGRNL